MTSPDRWDEVRPFGTSKMYTEAKRSVLSISLSSLPAHTDGNHSTAVSVLVESSYCAPDRFVSIL
jgi:hypothetical protein